MKGPRGPRTSAWAQGPAIDVWEGTSGTSVEMVSVLNYQAKQRKSLKKREIFFFSSMFYKFFAN